MELRRYALILWRWSWLIVLGTLIAGGASYLVSKRQVPIYQANTLLMVSQSKSSTTLDSSMASVVDRLAATYAELMVRQPVMDAVIRNLELETTAGKLAAAVKVTPVRNTQLIQLSVEDSNPVQAADIANEVPKVFIQQNDALQTQRYADSKASLQEQLNQASADITRQQGVVDAQRAAARVDQAALDREQRDLSEMQGNYSTLYKSYQDLRLEEARQLDTLVITEQAQMPLVPIRPKTTQNTLLAAVVGALLALGVAYLVEYLDDVIKDPDEVQSLLGLTALSVVPAVDEAKAGEELAVVASADSAATEAYRVLRTNLQFASVEAALRTLLITSASPTEGKTMTAANLGAALAQDGKRVILVDADLHRPRLHRVFKLPNNTGVTTALLAGGVDPDSLLQETAVPGLRVLTSGPLPPNAAELLGSGPMRALLADLAGRCDIVILDSPPAMALADAAILATRVDGVLLVLDATSTHREMARRAVASLQQVQARLLGAVMNRVPTHGAGSYYYYHYYSHYGHYYHQDGSRRGGRGGRGGGSGWARRLRHLGGERRTGQAPAALAAQDVQVANGAAVRRDGRGPLVGAPLPVGERGRDETGLAAARSHALENAGAGIGIRPGEHDASV